MNVTVVLGGRGRQTRDSRCNQIVITPEYRIKKGVLFFKKHSEMPKEIVSAKGMNDRITEAQASNGATGNVSKKLYTHVQGSPVPSTPSEADALWGRKSFHLASRLWPLASIFPTQCLRGFGVASGLGKKM